MSVREFASHLGVSDRMVSKWEAGGLTIRPRPVNQAALDTSLAHADPATRARFAAAADVSAVRVAARRSAAASTVAGKHVVVHPVDGKLMTIVDAGPYLGGHGNRRMWLPSFFMDVYPVTNAEYGQFVAVTGHRAPAYWSEGRVSETFSNHPVVGVTWHDATAYATWAAKTLPTGAQWEKAARGAIGEIFPWGDYSAPSMCNVRASGVGATTPVDWYDIGASPYGVFDMCGNVWEWCTSQSYPGRREIKGGAFTSSLDKAVPAVFNDSPVDLIGDDVGFRCVASSRQLLELLSI
jgi:formylglycine-generating enzyme required for sulfatase activity